MPEPHARLVQDPSGATSNAWDRARLTLQTRQALGQIACLSLAMALPAFGEGPQPWQEIPPPPQGVAGFARGFVATGPVIAGGNLWDGDSKLTLGESWRYNPADRTWHPHARLPHPLAFGAHGMVEDTLYLAGGDDGLTTRDEVVALPRDGTASVLSHLPQPVAYAGGAVLTGRLYVLGGSSEAARPLAMHDRFLAVDLTDGRVHALPSFPAGPVLHAAVAAIDNALYAFTGGQGAETPSRIINSAQAWRFDPNGGGWRRLPDYPFPVRGLAAVPLDDRRILLAGGYRDPSSNETPAVFTAASFIFDTGTETYRPAPPLPYAAMLVGLVVHEGWIYVFGGEQAPRQRVGVAYRTRIESLLSAPMAESSDVTRKP